MERNKRRSILSGVLTFAALALVLALVFRGQGEEILRCLRSVPLPGLLRLLLLGLSCPLLEAAAGWIALRIQMPDVTLWQAVTASFLGIFGNVATMGAGSIPLQSWYLSRHGLLPGAGVGMMTLCYALQKTTVLIYATVMLIVQGEWLRTAHGGLSRYITLGYIVCGLIILALILLCTWERVQQLALWGIRKLPDTGKWRERKAAWSKNIAALRTQSKALLADRGRCGAMLLLYMGRSCLLYTVSYYSISLLEPTQLSFWQVQLLSSVMVLIANAIPNVGGVGPAEFAFTLLYSPFLGRANAASAMVLYRAASYFFPFLVSILFFFFSRCRVGRQGENGQENEIQKK